MYTTIADNIKNVRDNIAEAALASGRNASDVLLVAAAKTHSAELVREAVAAGVDAVGENRVQEMFSKRELHAYDGAPLHFIGHLQSNKAAKIVGVCDLIESVDSVSLLSKISKKAVSLNITQNILLEINIGCEPQKAGIMPDRLDDVLGSVSQFDGIKVLGFMAIPPINDEKSSNCVYFDKMYQLYIDIRAKKYDNISVRFLSMGMSDSYVDAIRAGANIVRVGSSIFGRR